jgi:hypothetical protein
MTNEEIKFNTRPPIHSVIEKITVHNEEKKYSNAVMNIYLRNIMHSMFNRKNEEALSLSIVSTF